MPQASVDRDELKVSKRGDIRTTQIPAHPSRGTEANLRQGANTMTPERPDFVQTGLA
jgi:hypothetical protein